MSLPNMRLAASGPAVDEVPGGAFTGMQLRLAEAVTALAAQAAVGTSYVPLDDAGAVTVQAVLPTPQRDRRYAVRCHFQMETISATTGTFDARLEGSYDGTTWWFLAGNSVATNADNETVTVNVDFPMTLGSELPTTVPVAEADRPNLRVRCSIKSSGTTIHSIPNPTEFGNRILISLAEYA